MLWRGGKKIAEHFAENGTVDEEKERKRQEREGGETERRIYTSGVEAGKP